MKRVVTAAVVVLFMSLSSVAFADTFADYYDGKGNSIAPATAKALADGQSFAEIVSQAKDRGVALNGAFYTMVAAARDAGVSDAEIWSAFNDAGGVNAQKMASVSNSTPG